MRGQFYAVLSGLLAALASLCGKFAVADDEAHELCETSLTLLNDDILSNNSADVKMLCGNYLLVIRGAFFISMFTVNCVMWTAFTKALRFSSTSLEATIINTASNFFFTAIVGQVLFEEVVTGLWWMGTVLILCGLLVIHHSKNVVPRKTRKKSQ